MLPSTFATLDAIPEGDRQHYKLIGGRYVLELDGQHPVQTQNQTLITEKNAATARATSAEAEVETLKAQPTLAAGQVAVPKEDAQFIEVVKPLGKPAEIKTRLETSDKLAREAHLRAVAKLVGYDEDAILLVPNLPEIEIRDVTVDGKVEKRAVAKFKGADGKDAEQNFPDHVKATPTLAPFQPMLTTKAGGSTGGQQQQQQQQRQTSFIGQEAGGGKPAGTLYDRIRAERKAEQENKAANDKSLETRLGMMPANQQ
jgi:hypothetical protein